MVLYKDLLTIILCNLVQVPHYSYNVLWTQKGELVGELGYVYGRIRAGLLQAHTIRKQC